jgi:hypothetical protein
MGSERSSATRMRSLGISVAPARWDYSRAAHGLRNVLGSLSTTPPRLHDLRVPGCVACDPVRGGTTQPYTGSADFPRPREDHRTGPTWRSPDEPGGAASSGDGDSQRARQGDAEAFARAVREAKDRTLKDCASCLRLLPTGDVTFQGRANQPNQTAWQEPNAYYEADSRDSRSFSWGSCL